jgi:hypothetical protein
MGQRDRRQKVPWPAEGPSSHQTNSDKFSDPPFCPWMARRQPNRVISLSCFICNYPLTNATFKHICTIFFIFILRNSLSVKLQSKYFISVLLQSKYFKKRSELPVTNITHFAYTYFLAQSLTYQNTYEWQSTLLPNKILNVCIWLLCSLLRKTAPVAMIKLWHETSP